MSCSSKACILELILKMPHKGQEVRDAVVACELCSPMGTWGFLSVTKNLSELLWVSGGCLVAKRAFNALDILYYSQNACPRPRECNGVAGGHLVWWFPARLVESSKAGGVFESPAEKLLLE